MLFLGNFLSRTLGRMRFPSLFVLTATLFVLDVMIPDVVPLADEIILGLLTLMLGSWKERKAPERDPDPETPR